MACPQGLVAFQYGAREVFCGGRGRGGECLVEVKEFRFISTEKVCFYGGGTFLRRRHTSTAEAHFYGGGTFLRRRHISTAETHFYSGGIFLRRRRISTAEAHFFGGGTFLRRRCISMKEVNLKAIGVSLVWQRGTNVRRR